jgi:uncharacterized protein (TIGR00255 family)
MAVLSMTGYASVQTSTAGTGAVAGPSLGVEVRSVNGRFLDLSMRLPDELRACEPTLRELVQAALKRGKVELRLNVETQGGHELQAPGADWLVRLDQVQAAIRAGLADAGALSVADVLKLSSQAQRPAQDLQASVPAVVRQALQDLLAARAREGQRLARMLTERTAQLRQLAGLAAPLVPQLVEQHKARFLERWREALALTEGSVPPESAQERALTEATAYAIRIDVAEEITRLGSHLDEIDRLLAAGGEIGKRLDFLIQELHREANTLGSKSSCLELTRISVDMKVLIEQMREQVQNIE